MSLTYIQELELIRVGDRLDAGEGGVHVTKMNPRCLA